MHQEHEAGFTEFTGYRQTLSRRESSAFEGTFEIHLGARPLVARDALRIDRLHNSIAGPSNCELFRW